MNTPVHNVATMNYSLKSAKLKPKCQTTLACRICLIVTMKDRFSGVHDLIHYSCGN